MSPVDSVFLPLDELLEILATQRFYLGVDTHLRLQRFLDHFSQQPDGSLATLRFQLAALLCHSAEEQALFYKTFDDFAQPFLENTNENAALPPPVIPQNDPVIPATPPPITSTPPVTKIPTAPVTPTPTVGRSGPIRVELSFPANPLRIWNTLEMDQAVRPLREKEWAPVQEWDIPATILRTIRAGGMPTFQMRRRKRPPQYLLLIDQKSPRDHLAGLYTELAQELNRRDITAEYFFYDTIPYRCWKDRREPDTFTTLDGLQSEYAGYKLLLIGGPDGLLDRPDLRPSNLALDLREHWSQVALLCFKPTSEWGNAELALCQLFPVVPANAAGLQTLLAQWGATEVFSPEYWKSAYPEAAVPETRLARPQDADALIEEVQRYLGRNGFQWLCAAAVYPEIYWELTALLHDESIPPDMAMNERDMNRVWWVALLRLSRLSWFRKGSIPAPVRERLRSLFETRLPLAQRQEVRAQLLKVLRENPVTDDSYAAVSQAFTIAWLDHERAKGQPDISEVDRVKIDAEFQEQMGNTVALSDIEAAVGRQLIQEVQTKRNWLLAPEGPLFQVLWVDDKPDTNLNFQMMLESKLDIQFTNVTSTKNALEVLAQRGFHLIVSDTKRGDDTRAGIKMMHTFQEQQVWLPVMFSTTETSAARCREELLQLGAKAVLTDRNAEQEFIEAQVHELRPVVTGFQLLWVDDHPENNTGISKALEERGLVVTLALSTEEALVKLGQQNFQAILSDLGRGDSPEAGLEMLYRFKERGMTVPIGFFAARSQDYREKLLATGALLATSNGDEVTKWVLELFEQWEASQTGQPPDPTPAPGLQVLWVDDDPENNERFQDELNELIHAIFTNVIGTAAALEYSARSHFDVVVSDISRHGNNEAGAEMLRALQERNVTTPVIFYTTPQMVEKYGAELRELGAAGVFDSKQEIRSFLGEQLRQKQAQQYTSGAEPPPENVDNPPYQQQSTIPPMENVNNPYQQQSAAPPDTRAEAARMALDAGEAAMATGNYAAAKTDYQQALAVYTEIKDDAGRANAQQALGKLAVATNDLEGALKYFQSASTLYLMLDFQPAYAYALMDIGSVQVKLERLEAARKTYEEALGILEELGDAENVKEVNLALENIHKNQQSTSAANKSDFQFNAPPSKNKRKK